MQPGQHDMLPLQIQTFGYDDVFVKQGKPEELERLYGLDAKSIAEEIYCKFFKNNI